MSRRPPRLIIISQMTAAFFDDWVKSLAAESGPIELWSANAPTDLGPDVIVQRAPVYDNSTVWSRLRTWSLFTGIVALKLLIRRQQVPLYVVTNPPLMLLIVGLLSKMRGYSFGLLEWDIYPQIAEAMSIIHREHLLYRLWYHWHGYVLRHAAVIVTISEPMANELQEMASTSRPLPIKVIPNWVDTKLIRPCKRANNPFAQAQGLTDNQLVILYSGNMGASHAIETILEVAERLRAETDIVFIFIGKGTKRAIVEDAIQTGRTPNVRLLPWQSNDMLPYTLSSSNIGIVTLSNGCERLSMPSKTYSLMAAGNALLGISRAPNGLTQTIAAHRCGANFAPDAPEQIAEWVRTLAADRQQLQILQAAARAASVTHYSQEQCLPQLNRIIQETLIR